jgi:UDP-glucose:(heptosyl)LPS alpha-1,3-glucosyltransferase
VKIALIRKNYRAYGGAENYLKHVARALKAKGHEIHIFSADKWPDNTVYLHKLRSLNKPSFIANGVFALVSKAAITKEKFDCILSFERTLFQDIYRAGDGCHREWLKKRKAIEPLIKRISFDINIHHQTLLYLEKICLLNSKAIIANSNMVKRDIMKHYSIPDEKIKVVYNGVDLKRFQPIETVKKKELKNFFGIKEDKVIIFVGVDAKRKGLTTLFRAYSLLDDKDIKIIVVGKKDSSLSSLAKTHGIDKQVIFWGTDEEIEKIYLLADVFVLPTMYDPFSNATLEAMASGLPVITTLNNGASELIVNGDQGFVIEDPLDSETLSHKISAALQRFEYMGKKARMRAEEFSLEQSVDSILNIVLEHGG